ncbi:MAG: DUF2147 domain-containing protein [Pseudomonadota bacterium]
MLNPLRTYGLTAVAVTFAALCFSSASAVASPLGVWLDHTQRGAIELYECGASVCGRVVWMKNPLKENGRPVLDGRNPEAARRDRPICGMKIIGKLRRQGDGTWDGGWIYSPERGQEFSVRIIQRSAEALEVTGYIMAPTFGQTFRWTRAPDNIGACAPIVEAATQ